MNVWVRLQAAPGSKPLSEGSVLVDEDRCVVGAVEELFGPVVAPLYALRRVRGGFGGVGGGGG